MVPQKGGKTARLGGPPPFANEAIRLLSFEAIKLLGYEAIRLYGHVAVNAEASTQFGADRISCRPHLQFRCGDAAKPNTTAS